MAQEMLLQDTPSIFTSCVANNMSILCRCTTGSWRMTQRTSCCQVALLAQAIDINKPSY